MNSKRVSRSPRLDVECRLSDEQVNQLLHPFTGRWLLTDDALKELDNDLQSVINCTNEGDAVVLNVSGTIVPSSRIVIPWNLTISGAVDDVELVDGVFPAVSKRVSMKCTVENDGIFLVRSDFNSVARKLMVLARRSKSVMLANMVLEECLFNTSDAQFGIIEVEACEGAGTSDVVRLHHVGFRNNRLIGGMGLLMNGPSCSATELIDVGFKGNDCGGVCGAALSQSNTLRHVVIEHSRHVGVTSDVPLILAAPKGSETIASDLATKRNEGTVIFIDKGNLTLKNSSFSENSANVTGDVDRFGSCLHLVDSSVKIENCSFARNEAVQGGVVRMTGSYINVIDCTFMNNSAENGAVFYAVLKSRMRISSSIFSFNTAQKAGSVVHSDKTAVSASDSLFDRNVGGNNGCFWFPVDGTLTMENSNFTQNRATDGAAISFFNGGTCILRHCVFHENSVKTSGGSLYVYKVSLTVTDSRVFGGNATYGGFLLAFLSEIRIDRSRLDGNFARLGGCLVARSKSNVHIIRSTINGNKASSEGGGLWIKQESYIHIQHSNLLSNSAEDEGGGMILGSSKMVLIDVRLMDNHAKWGGAIKTANDSEITVERALFGGNRALFGSAGHMSNAKEGNITNCSFVGNEARTSGGSLYILDSMIKIEECQFRDGKARSEAFVISLTSLVTVVDSGFFNGSASNYGGCFQATESSTIKVMNTSFVSCQAKRHGGAINVEESTLTMIDCSLMSSKAKRRGALFISETTGTISGCKFFDCISNIYGGAVCVESSIGRIRGSEFRNNTAKSYGGSIFAGFGPTVTVQDVLCIESSAQHGGCLQCLENGFVQTINMTVAKNRASTDGGGFGERRCRIVASMIVFHSNKASGDG